MTSAEANPLSPIGLSQPDFALARVSYRLGLLLVPDNKWRERMTGPRRFPPPWIIEEANNACFIVKDHNGQALSYVYYESESGRRTAASLPRTGTYE